MFNRAILVNIALFMERVQVTGKEAFAWSETYQAVVAQINAIDKPAPPADKQSGEAK